MTVKHEKESKPLAVYTVVLQERGSWRVWWLGLEVLLKERCESLKQEGKKRIVFWVCMFLCSSCSSSVKPSLMWACISHTGLQVCRSGCEHSGCGSDLMMWHIAHQLLWYRKAAELLSLPVPICCLFTWIFNFCLFAWFSKNHQHAPLSSSPVSQVRLTASRWPGAATASPSARTTATRRTAPCALTPSSSVRVGSA